MKFIISKELCTKWFAGVFGEPFDVSLIAAVEEDGPKALWAHPALGVDEIPLWKIWELGEAEVVESLRKVLGFVSVLLLLLLLIRWL